MRIRLTAPIDGPAVQADRARRQISGVLVPFGSVGTPSQGPARIMFDADGEHITAGGDVWLNREHDPGTVLGKLTQLDATDSGLLARFSVLETAAGSDALVEAAAGARAGLSVEAEIRDYRVDSDADGELVTITASTITEAALCRYPAFSAAAVTNVAATAAPTNERETMTETVAAVAEPTAPELPTVAAAAPAPGPAPMPSGIRVNEPIPTLAEYVIAMGRGDHDVMRRVRAAAPHTFVADVAGLVPESIVGPVVSLRDGSAPLFNALGPNSAPMGSSFRLPVVTTELAEAAAATEKSDVTSQLVVGGPTVAMTFVKRSANISAEAIQYTQPGVVQVALDSLADAINLGCEEVVTDAIEAATGTNTPIAVAGDGSDAWSQLAAGVAAFFSATGRRPDVFACPVDVWSALAGMTNSLGQPLIQGISQDLTGGWGNVFGVPIVVSPNLTAAEAFLLSSYGVKSWASGPVQMDAREPSIMGYAIGAGRNVGLSIASPKFITPVTVTATP